MFGLKVGQPWIANRADSAHEELMRSGDHHGEIEIHWLVYTFPWR